MTAWGTVPEATVPIAAAVVSVRGVGPACALFAARMNAVMLM
jgi:hypothetical protein